MLKKQQKASKASAHNDDVVDDGEIKFIIYNRDTKP